MINNNHNLSWIMRPTPMCVNSEYQRIHHMYEVERVKRIIKGIQ